MAAIIIRIELEGDVPDGASSGAGSAITEATLEEGPARRVVETQGTLEELIGDVLTDAGFELSTEPFGVTVED